MPGCGRQAQETGPHGKIESNAATGNCVREIADVFRHMSVNGRGIEGRQL